MELQHAAAARSTSRIVLSSSSSSFCHHLLFLLFLSIVLVLTSPAAGQQQPQPQPQPQQLHDGVMQPVNEINLIWWEPDADKENGSAPEAGGGGGTMAVAGAAPAGDYHDHFVRSDEARGPAPQSGQRKITHVPASSRSADQYEFVPESRKVVRKGDAAEGPLSNAGPSSVMTLPQLVIMPPFLDFKERALCMPAVEAVSIINTSEQEELHLFSISTDSVHFHSSFFKQSVIPPLGNTTVSIVFLPRTVGPVENQLVVQTSVGHLIYQVYGQGILNPYRLHPFVGAKVPAEVTYRPPIEIYNPHDTPLHVTEIFTSGGFLHLTLPPGTDDENTAQLWTIEPHQKKKIINLAFMSQQPGKYTGFVNIKSDKDNMILHVEVMVVKGGLHRTPEEVDFATLVSPSDKRTASLLLLNSGSTPVQVSEIYPLTPDPQLFVNFTRTVIPPNMEVEIASFTYTGRSEGQFNGKLLLRTNDTNPANARMEIPYKARVLHGSLGYLPLNTTFAVGAPPFQPVMQSIVFTNKFNVPLAIFSAELDDPHFEVVKFSSGLTAQPGATWPPITIQFLANRTDMMYVTELALSTNVSVLRVPLHCYHGHLSYSVLDTTEPTGTLTQVIDFDVLGVNEIRTRTINLTNSNPVKVDINWMETNVEGLVIKLDSVWNSHGYATSGRLVEANKQKLATDNRADDSPFLALEPGNSAIFTVELSSSLEEQREGAITFHTAFEDLQMVVRYHAIKGSLTITPSIIQFDTPAFPGRLLNKVITAKSTYSRPIHISSITSSDARMIPLLTNTTLQPNQRSDIGIVLFDASKGPLDDNYLVEPSMAAQAGLSRAGEPLNKRDIQAHQRRVLAWKRLEDEGNTEIRGTLTVNTDVVMGYTLAVRASLAMPAVPQMRSLDFDLTQVGSRVGQVVPVHNPSDHSISVQILPFTSEDEVDPMLPWHQGSSSFYLPPEALTLHSLAPHATAELGPVFFAPHSLENVNATLYIKNNLTIIDAVELTGEGGSGQLLFEESGDEVGELLFQVDRAHLLHCTSNDPGHSKKEVVLTKVFRAVNKGNLPVDVRSLAINGRKCEGYGFAVEGCEAFVLGPGEVRDVRIAFRPDFSSSMVKRDLLIATSQGTHSFPLVATLPYDLLPLCVDSQPHGDLEETVKNTVKGFMLLVFAMMSLVLAKEYFPRNKRGARTSSRSKKSKDKKGKFSDPEPELKENQTTIELSSAPPRGKKLPMPSTMGVSEFERLLEIEFAQHRQHEKDLLSAAQAAAATATDSTSAVGSTAASADNGSPAAGSTAVSSAGSNGVDKDSSSAANNHGSRTGPAANGGSKAGDRHSLHLSKDKGLSGAASATNGTDTTMITSSAKVAAVAAPSVSGSGMRRRSESNPTPPPPEVMTIIAPGPQPRSTAVAAGSSGERRLTHRTTSATTVSAASPPPQRSTSLASLPPLIPMSSGGSDSTATVQVSGAAAPVTTAKDDVGATTFSLRRSRGGVDADRRADKKAAGGKPAAAPTPQQTPQPLPPRAGGSKKDDRVTKEEREKEKEDRERGGRTREDKSRRERDDKDKDKERRERDRKEREERLRREKEKREKDEREKREKEKREKEERERREVAAANRRKQQLLQQQQQQMLMMEAEKENQRREREREERERKDRDRKKCAADEAERLAREREKERERERMLAFNRARAEERKRVAAEKKDAAATAVAASTKGNSNEEEGMGDWVILTNKPSGMTSDLRSSKQQQPRDSGIAGMNTTGDERHAQQRSLSLGGYSSGESRDDVVPRKDRASTANKAPPGVIGSRKGLTASMPATASGDILPQRPASSASSLTALLTTSAPAVPVTTAASSRSRPLVNPWANDDDEEDSQDYLQGYSEDEQYGGHHHTGGTGVSSLFAGGGFGPFVSSGMGPDDYYASSAAHGVDQQISAASIFAPQGPFSAFSAGPQTWGAPAHHHPHHHHSGAALPAVSSLFSLPAPLVPSPPASQSLASAPTHVPTRTTSNGKRPLRSPPGLSSPPIAIQQQRLHPLYEDLDGGLEYGNDIDDDGDGEDEMDEIDGMTGGSPNNYDPFLSPSASFFSSSGMNSGSPSASFFSAFGASALSSSPTSSPSLEPASTPSYDLFASHPLGFGRRPIGPPVAGPSSASLASSRSAAAGAQPSSAQSLSQHQQQMNRKESYDSYFAAFDAPLGPHHHHHQHHSGSIMTINSMHMAAASAIADDEDGLESDILNSYDDSRTSSMDSLAANPDSLSFDLIDERDGEYQHHHHPHHRHHHPTYYHAVAEVDEEDDDEDTTFP